MNQRPSGWSPAVSFTNALGDSNTHSNLRTTALNRLYRTTVPAKDFWWNEFSGHMGIFLSFSISLLYIFPVLRLNMLYLYLAFLNSLTHVWIESWTIRSGGKWLARTFCIVIKKKIQNWHQGMWCDLFISIQT